jgi:hypothetical protein
LPALLTLLVVRETANGTRTYLGLKAAASRRTPKGPATAGSYANWNLAIGT